MKRIVILGSTGSIGTQTLDVVRTFPEEFEVLGLSAWSNRDLLQQQAWEFRPPMIFHRDDGTPLELPPECRRVSSIEEMASHGDVELVVQGMVGNAGLLPTLAALQAGKQVALANKEPIVVAGELLTDEARRFGGEILPVDSEPSAIWQCLRGEAPEREIRRLFITASGGPFRKRPLEELTHVTPAEALRHPTWDMGSKITIDSSTLMNKGFEVIEAHWLFRVPWEQLEVVVHPQSIIHSMVEFTDGSVKAQLGWPDMRVPIQYAMFYPRRPHNPRVEAFDPVRSGPLTFEPLDEARYPCFTLALEAGRKGGTYPAVLSAADEVAVQRFLGGEIRFSSIHGVVAAVLDRHQASSNPTTEELLVADAWARQAAKEEVVGVA